MQARLCGSDEALDTQEDFVTFQLIVWLLVVCAVRACWGAAERMGGWKGIDSLCSHEDWRL